MSDADLEEVRDAARRNGVTVSAWVRRTLRQARDRDLRGAATSVRELRPRYDAVKPVLFRYVELEIRVLEHDLEAVRKRYGLGNWKKAAEEAVCRQAIVPMTKEEALAMRGSGWPGDLEEIRDLGRVRDW